MLLLERSIATERRRKVEQNDILVVSLHQPQLLVELLHCHDLLVGLAPCALGQRLFEVLEWSRIFALFLHGLLSGDCLSRVAVDADPVKEVPEELDELRLFLEVVGKGLSGEFLLVIGRGPDAAGRDLFGEHETNQS